MACNKTWTSTATCGSMRPELGRTQYLGVGKGGVSGKYWRGGDGHFLLFWSSSFYFKGDRLCVRVVEAESLGDFVGERT